MTPSNIERCLECQFVFEGGAQVKFMQKL
jgi:hypothetical protein